MKRRADSGVTLMEIIVVLVILMILLGLAVGIFRGANRDMGLRASTHHVVALLRAAEEHARAENSPAQVVIDTEAGAAHSLTRQTVMMWHLEDANGAFNRVATVTNARSVPGYIGMGHAFGGSSSMDCGEIPVNLPDPGLALEFYLKRPDVGRGEQTICTIGDDVFVKMQANGRLQGRIGNRQVNSGQITVRPEEWIHVLLIYNTLELKLIINGAEAGSQAGTADWKGRRLILGSSKSGFVGILDEFEVSLIVPQDRYFLPRENKFELPEGTALLQKKYFVVWFDPEGRLENAKHPTAVRFWLVSPKERRRIDVSAGGVVTRTDDTPAAEAAPSTSTSTAKPPTQ